MMLRTNIKIAVRNMWKNRFYSFINIFGLAIGLATCMIMYSYIKEEISYDRFHKDGDRIFRVNFSFKVGGKVESVPYTSVNLGPTLKEEFPEVEEVLRIEARVREMVGLVKGDQFTSYPENRLLFTDPNFFTFYSFPLLFGEPDSVLFTKESAVLTKSALERYFGSEQDLESHLGKTILVGPEKKPFIIKGIAVDFPQNSHLKFNILLPLSSLGSYDSTLWINQSVFTYVKLSEEVVRKEGTVRELEKEVSNLVEQKVQPDF